MDDFPLHNMIDSSFLVDFASPEIGSISPVGSESDWSTNSTDQVYQLDTNMWLDVNSYISSTPASPPFLWQASPESLDIGADELYFLSLPEDAKPLTQPRKKEPSPAVLQRRRAQNRVSQRAYRNRKDKRVIDLEEQIDAMSAKNTALQAEFNAVSAELEALRREKADLVEWKQGREAQEQEKRRVSSPASEVGKAEEVPMAEEERSFTVKVMISRNPGEGLGIDAIAVVEG